MENFNREEVKEEVLKVGKWKRFFFMTVYAFAIQFALNIALVIAFIQFLFFLFTSKINEALFNFNKQIFLFFDDTLSFLLFQTEEMPFPFKKSSNEDDDMNAPEIVEGEADVIQEDESEEAFNDSEDKPADSEEEKEEDPKS
ncbi:MAG: DUF4389 domain-containing protein [SAR86 cluster bacterium]|jgi:hypothetical protein|uniref:DUF4389 domain-containing protein n=1 Tax=SAR86 cluster bacterium TaxID=2030880 RepID=A0A937JH14_9GAMM|nr:DUF4389 domain-containing protein [SAR86 cluster bacterium]MDG1203055.1 DUF4389 domain-containing protein [SAR86 cluster bacterium]MDG1721890.1 DUF4389 domain-containing protein [SAR86 cluster bacterium]|tara:strand:- start:836 stop:1261 length:426 start_codon:yes stop_codon:yes gene_type:complete